ncbi:hypothetical protein BKA62DRAFT_718103 [Auriculariales sp. MPI-PUGE-AT-0066]|nr:hypothetical protein BKA62DRAFT_718103 [Auriculariales sp. MPI-PUGE-AT-0066]
MPEYQPHTRKTYLGAGDWEPTFELEEWFMQGSGLSSVQCGILRVQSFQYLRNTKCPGGAVPARMADKPIASAASSTTVLQVPTQSSSASEITAGYVNSTGVSIISTQSPSALPGSASSVHSNSFKTSTIVPAVVLTILVIPLAGLALFFCRRSKRQLKAPSAAFGRTYLNAAPMSPVSQVTGSGSPTMVEYSNMAPYSKVTPHGMQNIGTRIRKGQVGRSYVPVDAKRPILDVS